MNEIHFMIHNLAQEIPLYDRQQSQRVIDLMVEKWAENCYSGFNFSSHIVPPDLCTPQTKQKH